ncbi:hypothetical protein VE02_09766 [Pseudogymnoascus sp. 03VT05]|nr:hypothetical protein VE02_09763 [Pseudogymnoascus sp. 03VT05]OBT83917.1 hypothetical protein VE02_09766 [Pseudogymnoascus sp. 03VT05]
MAVNMANLALDGGDPRLDDGIGEGTPSYIGPQIRNAHDPSVSFEEYQYYAKFTRADQDALYGPNVPVLIGVPVPGVIEADSSLSSSKLSAEKTHEENALRHRKNPHDTIHTDHAGVSSEEWATASRAVRTATWLSIFYLITTDILGPFGVAFALGTLGWGPGIALYTAFGIMAAFGGWLLYRMFLGLDSYEYPMKTYGDVAFRVYGPTMRHMVNIMQTIQLVFNVGAIVISNGMALSQMSQFKLCYAICCLIWAVCGFFLGQIRTLQKYGFIATFAIFLNVLLMLINMGVVAHSPPNYLATGGSAGQALGGLSVTADASGLHPPIITTASLPVSSVGFTGGVVGLMQAVYAYGGAMLFIEFMAEMRHPRDFWKAMIFAQLFIYICYIFYGCFIYGYQGQYSVNPSYQGVSPYAWQTVGNAIAVVSALIAAGLYGNIGIKVLYNNLFVDLFKAPPITSKRGKFLWAVITPVYWSIAFIVAAAIPNFFGLTSLIAALCIMQFSYTFPPLLHLGFAIKEGAMLQGEGFNPSTGEVVRHDAGIKRWARGFFNGGFSGWKLYVNLFNILFFLGSAVTAGLGAYSAIEALITAFQSPQITAFTCTSPLAPVSS